MANILLVDDSIDILRCLKQVLEHDGHTVTAYERAEWALFRWAELQPIDVVLTDIQMPGMDGPEFLERLNEAQPKAVYIGMTGYAPPTQHERMYRAGVQTILSKPFSSATLQRTIDSCLIHRDTMRNHIRDIPPAPKSAEHDVARCYRNS